MTQEEKQLLFKDLCARLPYGVKVKCASEIITLNVNWLKVFQYHLDEIKPCLRPMSSMTEEEYKEWRYLYLPLPHDNEATETQRRIDWLNAHHFDYRGLIPMRLALKALEGMYK